VDAFKKLVPAKDDKKVFEDKVVSHIREATVRNTYVSKVYPDIKEILTDFHKQVRPFLPPFEQPRVAVPVPLDLFGSAWLQGQTPTSSSPLQS